MDHCLLVLFSAALLCLVPGTTAALSSTEQEDGIGQESLSTELAMASIEAIPSTDFTRSNANITLEQILADPQSLQEANQQRQGQKSKRAAFVCSRTRAYGHCKGTAFVDLPYNPCNVKITGIWIRHGAIVDSIQIRYKFPNNHQVVRPRRGGGGGRLTHIPVGSGEKVVGIYGATRQDGHITQMSILKLTSGNTPQIYGPFGADRGQNSFVVSGEIKSIFGYNNHYLTSIGFYYEPLGICSN